MSKLRIKSGTIVKIIAGKDKGKTGKVLQTFPRLHRVVVEGVHGMKRHLRVQRAGHPGQIVEFFMPIDSSNVLPLDADGTPARSHAHARAQQAKALQRQGASESGTSI